MTLTLTDLFCGAGGSSSGAEQVPGVEVRMAANHWQLAVDTHNTNLPHADHDCADISQTDPRRYPVTDILWASPECTNHSQAKGRKRAGNQPDLFGQVLPDEAAERSRATMWDVCRFVETGILRGHPYKAFVVENVVDVRHWMFFDAWASALRNAGYCLHFVCLNSMHAQGLGAPAPQSRDRWYAVGHLTKFTCPDLARWAAPYAWCPACDEQVRAVQSWKNADKASGRYRQQYVWRCPNSSCRNSIVEPGVLPAAYAIDWALAGERIGSRAKPLAEKTMRRIEAGLRRYARPIHLEAGGNQYDSLDPKHPQHGDDSAYVRAWPADIEPFRTMHTALSKGIAYPPLLVPVEGRDGKTASPVTEPARTQTARNETAVCFPPFIAEFRGGGSDHRPVTEPLATVTASGNHHGLVTPPAMVMRNNSSKGDGGEMSTPITEPLRTITTHGHQSVIRWDHLLVDYYGNGQTRPVAEPMGTVTTVDRRALVSVDVDVEDCYFRMLEPHEIKAAMAFATDYVLLGNKREQVRLAGNAVTPPAARDLIAAVAESINGAAA